MKNFTLLLLMLVFPIIGQAKIAESQTSTLEAKWSLAGATNPTWNTGNNSREMVLIDTALYVIDKADNNKKIHVLDIKDGSEITSYNDGSIVGFSIFTDDNKNLMYSTSAYGLNNQLKLYRCKINKGDQEFIQLADQTATTGGRINFLKGIGDIDVKGTIYGPVAPSGDVCLWNIKNGVMDGVISTPAMIKDVFGTGKGTTNMDVQIIDDYYLWCFGEGVNPTLIFHNESQIVKKTALKITLPKYSGFCDFNLMGVRFAVVPQADGYGFDIYNIDDMDNPKIVASEAVKTAAATTDLTHLSIHVATKGEKAYIYTLCPNNEISASEFSPKKSALLTLPYSLNFDILSKEGSSLTSGGCNSSITIPKDMTWPVCNNKTYAIDGIDSYVNTYAAGGKIKLSTSSNLGSITTSPISLDNKSTYLKVELDACAWIQTSTAKDATIKVTYGKTSKQFTLKHKFLKAWPATDLDFNHYSVAFEAASDEQPVKIEAVKEGDSRSYIDNIQISWSDNNLVPPTIVANSSYITESKMDISLDANGQEGDIYYRFDEGAIEEGTKYTGPFTIQDYTTLYCAIIKDGKSSSVCSKLFYPPIGMGRLSSISDNYLGDIFYIPAVLVTYANTYRNQKFIQDDWGGILIDDIDGNLDKSIVAGDSIVDFVGYISLYNGMYEIIPCSTQAGQLKILSHSNPTTPKVVTSEDVKNHAGELVTLKNVKFSSTGSFAKSANYNLENSDVIIRTNYSDLDYIGKAIPTTNQDITGEVLLYNGTTQIIPRSSADIVAADETVLSEQKAIQPIYSENGQLLISVDNNDRVQIFATSGQMIYSKELHQGVNVIENLPLHEILLVKTSHHTQKVIIK